MSVCVKAPLNRNQPNQRRPVGLAVTCVSDLVSASVNVELKLRGVQLMSTEWFHFNSALHPVSLQFTSDKIRWAEMGDVKTNENFVFIQFFSLILYDVDIVVNLFIEESHERQFWDIKNRLNSLLFQGVYVHLRIDDSC